MSQAISIGMPAITVRWRRNDRAKRFILRVPTAGDEPVLTVPRGMSMGHARAFLLANEDWLRERVAKRGGRVPVGIGTVLPYAGEDVRVVSAKARRTELADGELRVHGPVERAGHRAMAFLKEAARDRLLERSRFYATQVNRKVNAITLRDTRSRWGSCSSNGKLMYSWRLIMAPPDVLDYVAAHEVAHLVEMNHSRRFWDLVHRLEPDCQGPRDWLRKNGGQLHRWEFTAA